MSTVLQTSGKHSNKHSGGVMKGLLSDLIFSTLQFQKQSSLPPDVIPHIGSFSSLCLEAGGVNPDATVKSQNIKLNFLTSFYIYHLPRETEINCPMNAPSAAINI